MTPRARTLPSAPHHTALRSGFVLAMPAAADFPADGALLRCVILSLFQKYHKAAPIGTTSSPAIPASSLLLDDEDEDEDEPAALSTPAAAPFVAEGEGDGLKLGPRGYMIGCARLVVTEFAGKFAASTAVSEDASVVAHAILLLTRSWPTWKATCGEPKVTLACHSMGALICSSRGPAAS